MISFVFSSWIINEFEKLRFSFMGLVSSALFCVAFWAWNCTFLCNACVVLLQIERAWWVCHSGSCRCASYILSILLKSRSDGVPTLTSHKLWESPCDLDDIHHLLNAVNPCYFGALYNVCANRCICNRFLTSVKSKFTLLPNKECVGFPWRGLLNRCLGREMRPRRWNHDPV